MATMTLVGKQTGDCTYEVTATPDHGNRIKLNVGFRQYGHSGRSGYLVMTVSGGMISAHRTFERAVFEANKRANRYVRAYSKPRTRTREMSKT